MSIRLNKFLAQATKLSRRAAELAIARGDVQVNGRVVTAMGILVERRKDRVRFQGRLLRETIPYEYLAFHKPRQMISTKSDPQGRKTIWDRLPERYAPLNLVGRLDADSEGLVLLTNDGALVESMTHPRNEVPKIYQVKVEGCPTGGELRRLVGGLVDRGEHLRAEQVKIKLSADTNRWLELVLHEGKYREVRRMCALIGHPVLRLRRTAIGPVSLGRLAVNKWRRLRPAEISALKHAK